MDLGFLILKLLNNEKDFFLNRNVLLPNHERGTNDKNLLGTCISSTITIKSWLMTYMYVNIKHITIDIKAHS